MGTLPTLSSFSIKMVKLNESSIFDYIRYVFSFGLLTFSTVVTFYAILEQKTSFWKVVPGWAALILFIVVLIMLGIMEGIQIALIELKRQDPDTYRTSHPRAYRLGQLAAEGDNIERFLLGRQVFVVCLVFFAAKLTTIHGRDPSGFLFPVPEVVQTLLLGTGLLACVIVVVVAQLTPQIIASIYPVEFMQTIVGLPAYYACIALETTGITHFTWILADLSCRACGLEENNNQGGGEEKSRRGGGEQNSAYTQDQAV